MKEKYDFDEEDMRPYLPIDSVLSGMFSLVTEIFRLRIEERSTSHDGESVNLVEETTANPSTLGIPKSNSMKCSIPKTRSTWLVLCRLAPARTSAPGHG